MANDVEMGMSGMSKVELISTIILTEVAVGSIWTSVTCAVVVFSIVVVTV